MSKQLARGIKYDETQFQEGAEGELQLISSGGGGLTMEEIQDNLASGVIVSGFNTLIEYNDAEDTFTWHEAERICSDQDATTITFDLSDDHADSNAGAWHATQEIAANRTLAIINAGIGEDNTPGKRFQIQLNYDYAGGHTVTWFPNINWVNGYTPALTPVGGGSDTFEFLVTAIDMYGVPTLEGWVLSTEHPVLNSSDAGISDIENWTLSTVPSEFTTTSLFILAYGNGRFVGTGEGTGGYLISDDGGINWASVGDEIYGSWDSLTYGNGLFVAVDSSGLRESLQVKTSPDGIIWTLRTTPANQSWKSVAYGNGLFVAVNNTASDGGVMTSPNGINWTSRTIPIVANWTRITYGNGLFVAGTSGGANDAHYIMTSPDGIDWTLRASAFAGIGGPIAYGNGLFVCVCHTPTIGHYTVMTSPDGITWTAGDTGSMVSNWYDITYGDGIFVAVGRSGTLADPLQNVMTSRDGVSWSLRTGIMDLETGWVSVVYGDGRFVAVGPSDPGNYIMSSTLLSGITDWSISDAYTANLTSGNGEYFIRHTNVIPGKPFRVSVNNENGAIGTLVNSGEGVTFNWGMSGEPAMPADDETLELEFFAKSKTEINAKVWFPDNRNGTPSIAAGSGGGTGATVSISGTDNGGEITLNTGTLTLTGSTLLTVTFSDSFQVAPSVVFSPSNGNAALLSGATMIFVTRTTTEFLFVSGVTALTASTTYKWTYQVK